MSNIKSVQTDVVLGDDEQLVEAKDYGSILKAAGATVYTRRRIPEMVMAVYINTIDEESKVTSADVQPRYLAIVQEAVSHLLDGGSISAESKGITKAQDNTVFGEPISDPSFRIYTLV